MLAIELDSECEHQHFNFLSYIPCIAPLVFQHKNRILSGFAWNFWYHSPCLSFWATSFVRSNWLNLRKSSSKTHLCRGQSVGLSSSLSAIFLIVLGKMWRKKKIIVIYLEWPTVVGTQFCYQFRVHANRQKSVKSQFSVGVQTSPGLTVHAI